MRLAGLAWFVLGALAADGCRAYPMVHSTWTPRFGPVIGDELVVGRALSEDDLWLATSLDALVHVRVRDKVFERVPLRGRTPAEHLWGLALVDGRLWTLLGRHVLAEMTLDGAIVQRLTLTAAHVGVFGANGQLVYQEMNFKPPTDALSAGPPGEAGRRPWGGIRTRVMPLDRGAVAALNLVSCGTSADGSLPCWFPDEAALSITGRDGQSRRLELEGLPLVPREALLAAESPRKPIRDAVVGSGGEIWVLASGHAPPDSPSSRSGGWLLVTYSTGGELTRRLELPEPARLILAVESGACMLLTWNGSVVEVRP